MLRMRLALSPVKNNVAQVELFNPRLSKLWKVRQTLLAAAAQLRANVILAVVFVFVSSTMASAQAACTVAEMATYPSVFYEDFGTGTGRTIDTHVLNHGFDTGGGIPDDWYAVGRSADLAGNYMKTAGNVDADGETEGRYLGINMRGKNEPSVPPSWQGEFYRNDGLSLTTGGLPAGATIGGFQFSTALVGTCAGCGDIPNFTLILEDGASSPGTVLGSGTSSTFGIVNDDIWRTASITVSPVSSAVSSVNLVLFNSQPSGADGNDVGVDNINLRPLVCLPPVLDFTKSATTINNIVGDAGVTEAGDTIRYTFSLTNNNTTTAYNVGLTETTFTGTGTSPIPSVFSGGADLDGGAGTATDIAPGQTLVFKADYTVTQADIDAGKVDNQARADFEDLANVSYSTLSDGDAGAVGQQITTVPLTQLPELTTTKTSGAQSALAADGSFTQVFTVQVENTGNVTITNPTLIDDVENVFGNMFDPSTGVVSGPIVTLDTGSIGVSANSLFDGDGAIGGQLITGTSGAMAWGDKFTVSFTVEFDATEGSGTLSNSATVGGTPSGVGTLNNGTASLLTDTSDVVIPVATGGVGVVKTAVVDNTVVSPIGVLNVGDTITYTYTVTNTSSVLNALNVTVSEQSGSFSGTGTLPTPALSAIAPNGTTIDGSGTLNDLAPLASLTYIATYVLTQTDIDVGKVDNQAKADATDPFGNALTDQSDDTVAGTGAGENDQTTVSLARNPRLETTKTAGTTSALAADGTYTQSFIVKVENTGNVTITSPSLVDDVEAAFGAQYSPSNVTDLTSGVTVVPTLVGANSATGVSANADFDGDTGSDASLIDLAVGAEIAPGEEFSVSFTVLFDATQSPVGAVNNAATAGGTPPTGTILNVGAGPQLLLTDTASVTAPTISPSLSVVKTASALTSASSAGDDISYTFVIENTGNIAIADVEPVEAGITFNGSGSTNSLSVFAIVTEAGFVDTDAGTDQKVDALAPGEKAKFTASYTLAQADVDAMAAAADPATAIDNSATATGDPVGATLLAAVTPSVVETGFTPMAELGVAKAASTVGALQADGTFDVTYTVIAKNTGNVTLDTLTVVDDLTAADQLSGAFGSVVTQPSVAAVGTHNAVSVLPAATTSYDGKNSLIGAGGILYPSDAIEVVFTVNVDPNAGSQPVAGLQNTATAGGDDPAGTTVTDQSNDGTTPENPVGGPDTTPTPVTAPNQIGPKLSLIKSFISVLDTNGDQVFGNAGDEMTYEFVVVNTGSTTLAEVVITDAKLGGPVGTVAILLIGETVTLQASYTLTEVDDAAGFVENTATANGEPVSAGGVPIIDPATGEPLIAIDDSDSGTKPDATLVDDPENTETADANNGTDGITDNDPTVTLIPRTLSPASLSGVVYIDSDRDGMFDPSIDTALSGYIVTLYNADGEVMGSTVSAEDGTYEMNGFPVGNDYYVVFVDPETGEEIGRVENLDFLDSLVLSNINQLIEREISAGQFTLVKTTNSDSVIVGQSIDYDITVATDSGYAFGPITITDTLPVGLIYMSGTSAIDGVEVVPTVKGRVISFTGLTLPATGGLTISLKARVLSSAPSGELINSADLVDGISGARLTETATATVRRQVEAVFECSDIIGKVFDDVDRDGYQDPLADNRAAITNQDIFGGKFGDKLSVPEEPKGEPGIPGVRLVTTDGTIITTDAYGRYNVPCAALPGDIGENFTLKLDTNSLPTGYRVTTENPRTMRVTGGIMTEMNFGASIGRVVDIDLTAAAFRADHEPVAELVTGLDGLLAEVSDTPSILRISYFTNGESADVAAARLDALEEVIRAKWRNIGTYKLSIERTVTRLQ